MTCHCPQECCSDSKGLSLKNLPKGVVPVKNALKNIPPQIASRANEHINEMVSKTSGNKLFVHGKAGSGKSVAIGHLMMLLASRGSSSQTTLHYYNMQSLDDKSLTELAEVISRVNNDVKSDRGDVVLAVENINVLFSYDYTNTQSVESNRRVVVDALRQMFKSTSKKLHVILTSQRDVDNLAHILDTEKLSVIDMNE